MASETDALPQNTASTSAVTHASTGESRPQWTSEYLANKRTHLAWLRTGIALVSFGMIVLAITLAIILLAGSSSFIRFREG